MTYDHDDDPLIDRLRAGLEEFTASVRREPPDTGGTNLDPAPDAGGGGGVRHRWLTVAAAAALVIAAVGATVWVTGDADAPEATPATQPPTTAGAPEVGVYSTTTDTADNPDDPVSSDPPIVFHDDEAVARIAVVFPLRGTLTVEGRCLVVDRPSGGRVVPIWSSDAHWDGAGITFDGGTQVPLGAELDTTAGRGVLRAGDGRHWRACRDETGAELDVYVISANVVTTSPPTTPAPGGGSPPDTGTGTSTDVVEVAATVLESPDHGPQLCGAVAESYPPQCSGADISNWEWSTLDREAAQGTTWGEYVLVGSYNADGTVFTLSEPARPSTSGGAGQDPAPDYSTPCPEPDGDWDSGYPDELLDEAKAARRVDGFGGLWIDEATGVYNVKVVGDVNARSAASAAIRTFYPGPVCIVEGEHTMRELNRIQRAVNQLFPNPRILGSGVDVLRGQLIVTLTEPAPDLEADLIADHGDAIAFDYMAQPATVDPAPATAPDTTG
jgi:hypothetical protein